MEKRVAWFAACVAILFCQLSLMAQKRTNQDNSQSSKIELGDSPISKARDQLKDIFRLRWQDDQLQIDREHWNTVAKQSKIRDPYSTYFRRTNFPADAKHISTLFHAISIKFGNRGTSLSSGGKSFTRTSRSTTLESRLTVNENFVTVEFQEIDKPRRSLSLRLNRDGHFRIMLLSQKEMLILEQAKSGSVRLVCDIGNGPRVFSGKSFREFARNDETPLSTELGILMEHFGIVKPILPMDQSVKKAVWAKLVLLSDNSVQAQFDKLVKQLDAPQFQVRQAAMNKINDKYDLFLLSIAAELKKESITPESKSRLSRIIKTNSRSNQIADVIRGFELLDSPEYLIRLGKSKPKNQEYKYLIDRLKKITSHDAGDRIEDWEKWAAEKKSGD